MKVIFALSNPPSKQFLWTRHNVGRLFVTEHLLKKYSHTEIKSHHYIAYTLDSKQNIVICLSENYMNLSGHSVLAFLKKNVGVSATEMIMVHDDLQHKFGNVRIKESGSAQGHNGVASVITALGTNQIKRLQLGIGRPSSRDPEDVANYVLTAFSKKERDELPGMFIRGELLLKESRYL